MLNEFPYRPLIAAVVPSYNRRDCLEPCIEATLGQTGVPDMALVVDNASTDGTEEMVRIKFPQAQVVRLGVNTGSAGGFHEGNRVGSYRGRDLPTKGVNPLGGPCLAFRR